MIYQCGKCSKWFQEQTGEVRILCAVIHPIDSCCHYKEREVVVAWIDYESRSSHWSGAVDVP